MRAGTPYRRVGRSDASLRAERRRRGGIRAVLSLAAAARVLSGSEFGRCVHACGRRLAVGRGRVSRRAGVGRELHKLRRGEASWRAEPRTPPARRKFPGGRVRNSPLPAAPERFSAEGMTERARERRRAVGQRQLRKLPAGGPSDWFCSPRSRADPAPPASAAVAVPELERRGALAGAQRRISDGAQPGPAAA